MAQNNFVPLGASMGGRFGLILAMVYVVVVVVVVIIVAVGVIETKLGLALRAGHRLTRKSPCAPSSQ